MESDVTSDKRGIEVVYALDVLVNVSTELLKFIVLIIFIEHHFIHLYCRKKKHSNPTRGSSYFTAYVSIELMSGDGCEYGDERDYEDELEYEECEYEDEREYENERKCEDIREYEDWRMLK